MDVAVRKGLAKRRLEVVEDSVDGERHRQPKDESETGVGGKKVVVFRAGGGLGAEPVPKELEGS
jgi:hypothetical protein